MLLIGLFIFAFSMVAYFVENSIGMIIVLRIIQGFTHGLITNAASAVVADIIPANKRGEGIGYYSTSMNIAMAIGPF